MRRFEIVLNIPSPYRIHLLKEMYRQLTDRGWGFVAHFMSDMRRGHSNRPLSWRNPVIDFPHRYWRDWGIGSHHFNPGLLVRLLWKRVDVLYVGGSFDTFTSVLAPFLAWRSVVRCTGVEGNTKTPGRIRGIFGGFKRWAMSHWEYIAVPGKDGANYISLHQGLTRRKMPQSIMLPNLIDETRFNSVAAAERDRLKVGVFGLKDGCICLIPARLDEVKGLVPLFKLLPVDLLEGWRIVLLGQGPLKDLLLQIAAERGFAEKVQILDYVPYDEMPKHYAAADLMLLPSLYDPNPLSVVEALHSGLAVALSDQLGNVEEGVTDGRNGWVLPVHDEVKYKAVLRKVFGATAEELQEKGRYSKSENATFWNTKKAISEFLDRLGV